MPRITQIISNFLFYYPLSQQQHIPILSLSLRAKSNGAWQSVDGNVKIEMRLPRASQWHSGEMFFCHWFNGLNGFIQIFQITALTNNQINFFSKKPIIQIKGYIYQEYKNIVFLIEIRFLYFLILRQNSLCRFYCPPQSIRRICYATKTRCCFLANQKIILNYSWVNTAKKDRYTRFLA